jgi:hypothetical protein
MVLQQARLIDSAMLSHRLRRRAFVLQSQLVQDNCRKVNKHLPPKVALFDGDLPCMIGRPQHAAPPAEHDSMA